MRRVAVTGIGPVGCFGVGREALAAAVEAGGGPFEELSVEGLRGRARSMRIARLAPFDREPYLPARKRRRMGELAQLWTVACLAARADAALDGDEIDGYPPGRRGAYAGTGYGCIDTTWDYLAGLCADGAGLANPFLFSESVANAPGGHSAIELDARGENVTFTCGDASAATAFIRAARAVGDGRVDLAFCGGAELLAPPLLRVLAALGSPATLGEGACAFVLEPLEAARLRGAPILAEVCGSALGGDPSASPTRWSADAGAYERVMGRAVEMAGRAGGGAHRVRGVYLHAAGSPDADAAERAAARRLFSDAAPRVVTPIVGALAAAGGFPLAAGVLACARRAREDPAGARVAVSASSWGGALAAIILSARPE